MSINQFPKMNNMKEILISDPRKVLKFYENQRTQSIISDSGLSDMVSLNKLEVGHVIPIDKERRVSVKQNTSVNIIDPNAAAINQAKENIKNDAATSSIIGVTSREDKTPLPRQKRKQPDSQQSCSEAKKKKQARRKTVVNPDIFGEE